MFSKTVFGTVVEALQLIYIEHTIRASSSWIDQCLGFRGVWNSGSETLQSRIAACSGLSKIGAEKSTNTVLRFLIRNRVQWAPKPYSNY